jgi:hypothetical protein
MIISLNVKDIFCNKLQTILQKLLDPWFCPLLWMLLNHMDAIVQFIYFFNCKKVRV